jgi:prolyl oligopeptidase
VPTLLYGYGAVNIAITPRFRAAWPAWLAAGGTLAAANLRGGGEYGREWHEAGMRERKQNVFDDFIAVGEHLISTGVTAHSQLALHGASGGLLVGAVMTQRPDLAAVALPMVGVMDMLRFHKFTIRRRVDRGAERSRCGRRLRVAVRLFAAARPPRGHLLPGDAYPYR